MGLLDGKVCLITGASRGIGAATAKRFVEEGAIVYANVRQPKNLDELYEAMSKEYPGKIKALYFDVRDEAGAKNAIMQIKKEAGRLDVLVNNAGIMKDALIGMVSRSLVDDIYETNFVNAAAWLLPRKTLERVGGFDPIFKHYEEDDNYSNRVRYHGLKIGVCPSAKIIHDHQASELSDERMQLRQQQFLLVEWTDINKPFNVFGQTRYYIRKWIAYMMHCDIGAAKQCGFKLHYCIRMRKYVYQSRAENKQRKPSWL